MTVNTRLKEARTKIKLSQEQMAERLGISFRAYWNYETGKRDLTQENLINLAQMFDFNLTWLLLGTGPMFLPQKSEKQEKYEHALSERKTIGQRLNWLQGEEHIEDSMLSKETGIDERRIRKIGLDELEPTVSEASKLCEYFGIVLDLFVNGRNTEPSGGVTQMLSPEEKKMLEFLKKAKENKLI